MKTVYFVRHGQSEGNTGTIFQTDDSPLTDMGKKQGRIVADRCSRLPIEYVVASPQPRAQETASIITERINLSFDSSILFRERKKPTAIEGKSFDDPEAKSMNIAWWNSLRGDGSRVADGENFEDLSTRAGRALEYLAELKEEHILVVTHGFYLRYLVARAIYGAELSPSQFEPLMRGLSMQNTGITVLRHNVAKKPDEAGPYAEWELRTWNDHAHLG